MVAVDTWGVLVGIDHVIVAAPDVAVAVRALEDSLGMSAAGGGRHEAHGTHNRLFWLGDSYVELMGVFDAELAAGSWWGEHIAATVKRGGGLAGVVLRSDALDDDYAVLHASGSTILEPSAGERRRPDGGVVHWRTGRLPAPDPDLGLVFSIEHDPTGAEWSAEDRAARAAVETPGLGLIRLARVEIGVDDVARTTMRLLRDFRAQFRPSLAGGGARDTSIGTQTLRLLPARGDRTGRVRIVLRASAVADPRETTALGCLWRIEPAR